MRANCIICSDFFDEINSLSAAPCGHVYHSSCLSAWIGQSHTCPECRSRVTQKNVQKLFFSFNSSSENNSSVLENEVLALKAELSAKNIELQTCKKEKEDTIAFVREAERRASDFQQAVYKREDEISQLRAKVKSFPKLERNNLMLEQMNVKLTNKVENLSNIEMIIQGSQKDVDDILKEYSNASEATKQLATYCTCLKRELLKVIESKSKLGELNSKLQTQNGLLMAKIKSCESAMASDKACKSRHKRKHFSSESKAPVLNLELNENNSPDSNTPTSSTHKNSCEQTSLDISPFTVSFNKSKFVKCIKSSSTATVKTGSDSHDNKAINIPFLSVKKQNNAESIVRTGYNGMGGHSNFINISRGMDKKKSLKRKV